jgi:23S rRNA pseudouridine2605 synthase
MVDGSLRLQKFLSRAGVASRRASEALITEGRVSVNGRRVVELGSKVDPTQDVVTVDGVTVRMAPFRWVMVHKPTGTLTTRSDPHGRPTVYGLVPPELSALRYVGRLDQGTEGLLLLTNEGDAAHRLMHPSYRIEREYEAWVEGQPTEETRRRLESGVELEDGMARAKRARLFAGPTGARIVLVLTEGRKREVRRMLETVGHPVVRLRRLRFGPVHLGNLKRGAWRDLSAAERGELYKAIGL